mgnify:CR=1 FL=1
MNRRNFIKTVPALTVTPFLLGNTTQRESNLTSKSNYFVNCYIQNQKYWPLEEYKKGIFGGFHEHSKSAGFVGEKWINGQLRFCSFEKAVDFINIHSLVVPFHNEIMYEVFHEKVRDQMVPPKHIFNYWVKLEKDEFPETIKWVHPDYIDHTADGALIEYVR